MSDQLTTVSGPRSSHTLLFFQIFALVFLLVLLPCVVINSILPETYASTARILVENDGTDNTGLPGPPGHQGYDPDFILTKLEVVQSQLVLSNVVAQLHLNEEWGKKWFNGETLKTAESLEILKNRVRLYPVKNTKLIAITCYSDNKEEAADIANAIAQSYRTYRFQSLRVRLESTLNAVQEAYQRQETEISQLQADLDGLPQPVAAGKRLSASPSSEEKLARSKQWRLDQLLDVHKLLFAKIEAEKLNLEMPKILVQITDTAQPGRAPIRPNKTLNTAWGVLLGIILGTLAGGFAVLVARRYGRKESSPSPAPDVKDA